MLAVLLPSLSLSLSLSRPKSSCRRVQAHDSLDWRWEANLDNGEILEETLRCTGRKMVSDATYDLCLPVLQDSALEDEDKTDQLEELLKKETPLKGTALENAILDVLWRFREGSLGATSPPPLRHTVLRKPSPAPWPISRAATTSVSSSPRLGASPLAPPGFVPQPFVRTMSSTNMTGSPFTSPRPSPRLAFNSPAIPHSPSLNAYEFTTETSPSQETYGDYGSDAVDWLVNDDAASLASSTGQSGLNAAAAEYVHPQQTEMTPYDMLRSIFGPSKSDDEIEATLAEHGYDLTATISAFMDGQGAHLYTQSPGLEMPNGVVIGKSMKTETTRPRTPQNQTRNGIVCRFWLSTGQCLRADCRFSHDLSNHVCKYVSRRFWAMRLTILDTGSWETVWPGTRVSFRTIHRTL